MRWLQIRMHLDVDDEVASTLQQWLALEVHSPELKEAVNKTLKAWLLWLLDNLVSKHAQTPASRRLLDYTRDHRAEEVMPSGW